MFNEQILLIADTKIIQDITLNHVYDFIKPSKMFPDLVEIVGRGIVFAEGEDHKRQRKMMNPAFVHSNVKVITTYCREF